MNEKCLKVQNTLAHGMHWGLKAKAANCLATFV